MGKWNPCFTKSNFSFITLHFCALFDLIFFRNFIKFPICMRIKPWHSRLRHQNLTNLQRQGSIPIQVRDLVSNSCGYWMYTIRDFIFNSRIWFWFTLHQKILNSIELNYQYWLCSFNIFLKICIFIPINWISSVVLNQFLKYNNICFS